MNSCNLGSSFTREKPVGLTLLEVRGLLRDDQYQVEVNTTKFLGDKIVEAFLPKSQALESQKATTPRKSS